MSHLLLPSSPRDRKLRQLSDEVATTVEKAHGRLEKRRLEITDRLNEYLDWPGVGSVMRLTRETTRAGKTTTEVAFAISSKKRSSLSARDALAIIRAHWGIENRLHWIRDVVFGEDACRVRSRNAPQVLASLRNAVVTRLHLEKVSSLTEELERLSSRPHRAIDYVVRPSSRRQD